MKVLFLKTQAGSLVEATGPGLLPRERGLRGRCGAKRGVCSWLGRVEGEEDCVPEEILPKHSYLAFRGFGIVGGGGGRKRRAGATYLARTHFIDVTKQKSALALSKVIFLC